MKPRFLIDPDRTGPSPWTGHSNAVTNVRPPGVGGGIPVGGVRFCSCSPLSVLNGCRGPSPGCSVCNGRKSRVDNSRGGTDEMAS